VLSQRAGSIQALVAYFVVPRRRYFPRLPQHRRVARYAQPERNEDTVGSRWKLLGKPASPPIAFAEEEARSPQAASRSRLSCCLVLCGLGVRVSPHGALGAPSPRCTWWRPRYYAQKIWSGPVLPPPKFPGVAMKSCLAPSSWLLASSGYHVAVMYQSTTSCYMENVKCKMGPEAGHRRRSSAIPARPSGAAPGSLGPTRRMSALVQLRPQNHHPDQPAAHTAFQTHWARLV
jgi:hypothetical protein